jgi:SAM-dependent methyltransferase
MDASAPELYERYLVPAITSVWANDLLDRIRPTREESVLDIACGTGVVARLVEQRGHGGRLIGIDLNTAMLAVARKKSPAVEWIEGSALNLPFEAGSFDVVLCQLGLQFFPDCPLALRKWCGCSNQAGAPGSASTARSSERQRRTPSCRHSTGISERSPQERSVPNICPARPTRSARGRGRPA